MQSQNALWQFFASVKLALVTISLLALTSIIGTIIPQKKPDEFYFNEYGAELARLFLVLDIPDMYRSWWFVSLLSLLCFNLIICSIDRFPGAWKQITADGLNRPEDRLANMPNRSSWQESTAPADTGSRLASIMTAAGWKTSSKNTESGILLFAQKGAWTRTGAYLVHISILIIFLGGVIGSVGGFKGSMVIPETLERDRIALFGSNSFKDLGFTVRCNSFDVDFYENGTPKDYVSSLTVIEDGAEVLTTEIRVNHPLKYKGITFYQSSYQGFQDFLVFLENTATGTRESFIVPFQRQERWSDEELSFGVINARSRGHSIVGIKVWVSDGTSEPFSEWLEKGEVVPVQLGDRSYRIEAKQLFATGLQVAKDPGVWWVYAGCSLMLIGLFVAFFMSHRRIWLKISGTPEGSSVLLTGTANKNRPGFERTFSDLTQRLQNHSGSPEQI